MSWISPVRLVMDMDVAGLSRPLSTDVDASSGREAIQGTQAIQGTKSAKSARNQHVTNKESRSTVSIPGDTGDHPVELRQNRREGSTNQTPAANGTLESQPAAAGQEPVSVQDPVRQNAEVAATSAGSLGAGSKVVVTQPVPAGHGNQRSETEREPLGRGSGRKSRNRHSVIKPEGQHRQQHRSRGNVRVIRRRCRYRGECSFPDRRDMVRRAVNRPEEWLRRTTRQRNRLGTGVPGTFNHWPGLGTGPVREVR